MSDYRPLAVVRAPVKTRSGYGAMSRDIVHHLIDLDKYDVQIHSINWGMTPMNALDEDNERDRRLLDRIVPEQFERKPDLYISISIPTEFRPMGRYNIGITAGIETTQAHVDWVKAMNVMDVVFTISEFSKRILTNSKYQAQDQNGNVVGQIECKKPVEVLNNCVHTDVFRKLPDYELEKGIRETLDTIPENYNFLFVGHWLNGPLGHDRKNVGLLIKLFFEVFKRSEFVEKPGLILKTSHAGFSLMDRERIKDRINQIRDTIELEVGEQIPNVYLVHGDLTDEEMNSLYNHSKVKTHISLTHGEGFGRPLLEACMSGKPIIATGFSGHLDFLDAENAILIGGQLTDIHDDVKNQWFIDGAKWLSVDGNMAATAMVEAFRNYSEWKKKANTLMRKNRKKFSYDSIAREFDILIDAYVPEFDEPEEQPKKVGLNLPKLNSPNLPKLSKNKNSKVQLPKLKKIK